MTAISLPDEDMIRVEEPKTVEGLGEDELDALRERGYTVLDVVSRRGTRGVYRTWYKRDNISEPRALKISHEIAPGESFQTAVALSKGRDWNIAEVEAAKHMRHPNISQVRDSFYLGNRTVNGEEWHDAVDLETLIINEGAITNETRRRKIVKGMIEGLKHLHGRGMIHRDFKSSQILVGKDDEPVIADFQTTEEERDIQPGLLVTRGSEQYTSPMVLNATLRGNSSVANSRNDVFGFGASVYELLTGEKAFDWRFVEHPQGVEIPMGEKTFRVGLRRNGQVNTDGISDWEFVDDLIRLDKRMKQKKIPYRWRAFVRGCLSNHGYTTMEQADRGFKKLSTGFISRVRDNFIAGTKYFLPGLGLGAVLGGIAALGFYASNREEVPKLKDLLAPGAYESFTLDSIDSLSGFDKNRVFERIVPAMHYAKNKLEAVEKSGEFPNVEDVVETARKHLKMDPRLVSAWYRAAILSNEKPSKGEKQEDLVRPGLAPRDFVFYVEMSRGTGIDKHPPEVMFDRERVRYGVEYLKDCLSPDMTMNDRTGPNVLDTFVKYFSTVEDVNIAKARSGATDYFFNNGPIQAKDQGNAIVGNAMHPGAYGYSRFLPRLQQKRINLALALYKITDDEGKVHFENIPEPKEWDGGYNPEVYTWTWGD
jgi:serine/threonine protein kinase